MLDLPGKGHADCPVAMCKSCAKAGGLESAPLTTRVWHYPMHAVTLVPDLR